MTLQPHAAVVVNAKGSGPRRLPAQLAAAGVDAEVIEGWNGLPASCDGFDALVLLGAGLLPFDDDRAPWLTHERALAAEAIERDVPFFGICFGAQLLAAVAGGEVQGRYGVPERGLTSIHAREAASDDAVFSAMPERYAMIENHCDVITRLPEGAALLASSDGCERQAFRVGASAWGVQFHPEVAADALSGWNATDLEREGFDLGRLYEDALARDVATRRDADALIGAFAAVVRSRVPAPSSGR